MTDLKEENCDFLTQLISLVRQNKILYEKDNRYYYNRIKKEKVWNDIATQTNKTASECKNKWTALREKFVRELKKRQKQSDSGSGTVDEPHWELFSEMLFLKDVTKPRKPVCNEKLEIIQYPSQSVVDEIAFPFIEEECSSPPPMKKKSFDHLCDQFGGIVSQLETRFSAGQQINNDSDADELFIRTVVSMMQDLPSSTKDEIKSDIFNKIVETRKKFRFS